MLFIPTAWRRNAMNIDMVEIITSPQPMYSSTIQLIDGWRRHTSLKRFDWTAQCTRFS